LVFFLRTKISSVPHAIFLFSRALGTTLSSSAFQVSLNELNKMSFALLLWKNMFLFQSKLPALKLLLFCQPEC